MPAIRGLKPTNYSDLGFVKGKDMYELVDDIGKLRFLTAPQDFSQLFDRILSK